MNGDSILWVGGLYLPVVEVKSGVLHQEHHKLELRLKTHHLVLFYKIQFFGCNKNDLYLPKYEPNRRLMFAQNFSS